MKNLYSPSKCISYKIFFKDWLKLKQKLIVLELDANKYYMFN